MTEAELEQISTRWSIIAGVHQGDFLKEPYTVATSMYRVEEESDVKV